MSERELQFGRLLALPLATVGILAAVLMWEIYHVGSLPLGITVFLAVVTTGIAVALHVRTRIESLTDHYESLLRRADAESRRAEAAARAKDEFLATLSHELRTPLNSVLGWARLLSSGKLDAAQSQRAVSSIERAGWAQARVIEDLLDMSRLVNGTLRLSMRPTFFQPIIQSALHALGPPAAAKQIAISTFIDPTLGPVMADPARLQQIVRNLVSNAIKFTPSGGLVSVRVHAESGDACFSVADTGIGFTPATAAQLFGRFQQADSSSTRKYGGLGTGLDIVRHLVELHGGSVSAQSDGPGKGSAFVVRLPIEAGLAAAAAGGGTGAALSQLRLDGVSVLLVDDDPMSLELARSSLEYYGASVNTATSVSEARGYLSKDPPDVLVSDLRMPQTDGLQLIHEVRELDAASGRHTPAAALTGLVRNEDRQRALTAGFEVHLSKPVDPAELAGAVARLAHTKAPSQQ
jgi:signal transduction histidine kinase/ActR/RegA family two-component response regulator